MHCSKKYNALVVASAPLQTELQLSCCHRPVGWAAQPCLEESWLGQERRDEALAARQHRRKKKKKGGNGLVAGWQDERAIAIGGGERRRRSVLPMAKSGRHGLRKPTRR
jgi:hypothetical protein